MDFNQDIGVRISGIVLMDSVRQFYPRNISSSGLELNCLSFRTDGQMGVACISIGNGNFIKAKVCLPVSKAAFLCLVVYNQQIPCPQANH